MPLLLNIPENILTLISGLGILQGILLSVLLYYHPRSDRSVNKFLSLYIIALSLVMTGPIGYLLFSWHSSFIFQPFPMLVGPFLYLYVRSYKETVTFKKAFPHLLFFVVFYFIAYGRMMYLEKTYPGLEAPPIKEFTTPVAILFSCMPYIHLTLYYLLSRKQLINYQKSIRHLFSETSQIDLRWVNWLINGYLFLIVSAFILFLLMMKYPQHFTVFYLVTMAIGTPYIYITTYKGITQPTIWQVKHEINKKEMEEQIQDIEDNQLQHNVHEKPRPGKQGMSDTRITEIVARITALMEDEKLYQETELTLNELSAKLNFPTHQVSQAINEGMNKNFYDLVNGYRVEEAKRLLLNSRNRVYTILSVGFEAGFNSKTTFNTVFKKFTGLTPTEYREQQTNRPATVS